MKDRIIVIIILFILCISAANVSDVLTVKPANPKYIIVKVFDSEYASSLYDVKSFIDSSYKKGYVLKTITAIGDYNRDYLVVMEKY